MSLSASLKENAHEELRPGNGTRISPLAQSRGVRYHCPTGTYGTCLIACHECRGAGKLRSTGLGSEAYRLGVQRCRRCAGGGLLPCPDCGVQDQIELQKPDPTGAVYWNRWVERQRNVFVVWGRTFRTSCVKWQSHDRI